MISFRKSLSKANSFIIAVAMISLAAVISFAVLLSKLPHVEAAGCWRDTICPGPSSAVFPGSVRAPILLAFDYFVHSISLPWLENCGLQGFSCSSSIFYRPLRLSKQWDQYNYSPSSRTISPTKILKQDDSILSGYPNAATLQGNESQLIFDFGKEVGGVITVSYSA